MSVAEEIAKLDELRKQGLLTQAEFDGQKKVLLQGGKKRTVPWLLRIPIVVAGVFVAYLGVSNLADSNAIPSCDSSGARSALKNAFEKNASANANTYQMLDLMDAKEVSFNEARKERTCTGTAVLNSGRRYIDYRLWRGANKNLLVEVN